MHVVAARPAFLDEASAPQEALEKEKNLLLEQAKDSGKSPKVLDKMVEGRWVLGVGQLGRGLDLCVCVLNCTETYSTTMQITLSVHVSFVRLVCDNFRRSSPAVSDLCRKIIQTFFKPSSPDPPDPLPLLLPPLSSSSAIQLEIRMRKYLETNALVRQAHVVAEGNPSVADHLTGLGDEVGGTVTLEGFARLAVGERECASSSGD